MQFKLFNAALRSYMTEQLISQTDITLLYRLKDTLFRQLIDRLNDRIRIKMIGRRVYCPNGKFGTVIKALPRYTAVTKLRDFNWIDEVLVEFDDESVQYYRLHCLFYTVPEHDNISENT